MGKADRQKRQKATDVPFSERSVSKEENGEAPVRYEGTIINKNGMMHLGHVFSRMCAGENMGSEKETKGDKGH